MTFSIRSSIRPGAARGRMALAGCLLTGCLLLLDRVEAAEVATVHRAGGIERYAFDVYGAEVGLPGSVVNVATQTSDGYLWVGTPSGLGRFDGVRFTNFRSSNAPDAIRESILCLHEDREGVLWVGTTKGLIRHRNGTFESVGLGDFAVRTLAEDDVGRLWIGTSGAGLHVWRDGRLEPHVSAWVPRESAVRALFSDSSGRLWIALEQSRGVLCLENGNERHYDGGDPAFGEVLTICESPRATLWFGTQREGLFRLEKDALIRFSAPEGIARVAITDLRPARDGGVWLAAGTLKHVVDRGRFELTFITGVPNDNVRSVHEDREGGLWLCAGAEGLIRMRQVQYRSLSTAEGLPSNNVKSVAEDRDGNLWLALQQHGVTQVAADGAVKVFGESEGIPDVEAAVIYPARDGSVWVGTGSRLYVHREGEWKRFSDLRFVRGLYQDKDGTMWVGTQTQGVFRFEGDRAIAVTQPSGEPILLATSFCEHPDGTLYIGTWRNGLYRVREGQVSVLDRNRGLPTDDVRAVLVDRAGRLWAGLSGRGIAVLEAGRWLNSDSLVEAVASQVSAIAEDEAGRLWLGTPAGIMWADGDELFAAARGESSVPPVHPIATSGETRTLPVWSGGQPVVWQTSRRELLFATRRGVIAIDPKRISANETVPPVQIERALIDRVPTALAPAVRMPAGAQSLAIEYTALSFVQPSHVFFKYKLEGYDSDWIEAGTRRTAWYNRLPPGDYVFRVAACNNDGVWNLAGSSVAIVQLPRFYQTRWFYALLALAAIGLVWALHRWSHRRLKSKLEQLERERAMENERRRIAQDLHDDLGASLTEIGLFAETARSAPAAVARPDLDFLSDRVRHLVGSLDAIVWAVNPANDSLDHLVAYMGEFFQELFRRSAIRGLLDISGEFPRYPLSAEERSNLFLAAKEAMNNILKHSGATEAWLRIRMTGDEFVLTLEDNGRGFDPAAPEHSDGNGLTNMRTRLSRIQGEVIMRSAVGDGTAVTITARFAGRTELPEGTPI